MTEEKFVNTHKELWQELEALNKIFSTTRKTVDGYKTLERYAELNRVISHHLAYAKTHFPAARTTNYLNQIVSIAHNQLFVREKATPMQVRHYFQVTFPDLVRKHKALVFLSGSLFIVAMIVIARLSLKNPTYIEYFFSADSLENVSIENERNLQDLFSTSSYIMTNNIRVVFLTFALGVTIFGTIYVLLMNGGLIGALWAHLSLSGYTGIIPAFWALILPHGVIELFCIFVAGAAGLLIGKSFLIPGQKTRMDALKEGAKEAALFIPGVSFLLVIAGLIEGFITPLPVPNYLKLLFALATFFALLGYFYFYRPRALTDK